MGVETAAAPLLDFLGIFFAPVAADVPGKFFETCRIQQQVSSARRVRVLPASKLTHERHRADTRHNGMNEGQWRIRTTAAISSSVRNLDERPRSFTPVL